MEDDAMERFGLDIEEALKPQEKLRRKFEHINAIPHALVIARSQLVPPIEQLFRAIHREPCERLNTMLGALAMAKRHQFTQLEQVLPQSVNQLQEMASRWKSLSPGIREALRPLREEQPWMKELARVLQMPPVEPELVRLRHEIQKLRAELQDLKAQLDPPRPLEKDDRPRPGHYL